MSGSWVMNWVCLKILNSWTPKIVFQILLKFENDETHCPAWRWAPRIPTTTLSAHCVPLSAAAYLPEVQASSVCDTKIKQRLYASGPRASSKAARVNSRRPFSDRWSFFSSFSNGSPSVSANLLAIFGCTRPTPAFFNSSWNDSKGLLAIFLRAGRLKLAASSFSSKILAVEDRRTPKRKRWSSLCWHRTPGRPNVRMQINHWSSAGPVCLIQSLLHTAPCNLKESLDPRMFEDRISMWRSRSKAIHIFVRVPQIRDPVSNHLSCCRSMAMANLQCRSG